MSLLCRLNTDAPIAHIYDCFDSLKHTRTGFWNQGRLDQAQILEQFAPIGLHQYVGGSTGGRDNVLWIDRQEKSIAR